MPGGQTSTGADRQGLTFPNRVVTIDTQSEPGSYAALGFNEYAAPPTGCERATQGSPPSASAASGPAIPPVKSSADYAPPRGTKLGPTQRVMKRKRDAMTAALRRYVEERR